MNEHQIPTGELSSVKNSYFDFLEERELKEALIHVDGGGQPGLDHCFILNSDSSSTSSLPPLMATLTHRASGRQLIVRGTQPYIQVYTANFLSGSSPFAQHRAIALETQGLPDAVNQPHFPSILLTPSDVYSHQTLYCLRHV